MKKSLIMPTLALYAMAMAMADGKTGRKFYREKPIALGRELTETEKLRRHREFSSDQTMHKYVINGVEIEATSKKVAQKIYERTHK